MMQGWTETVKQDLIFCFLIFVCITNQSPEYFEGSVCANTYAGKWYSFYSVFKEKTALNNHLKPKSTGSETSPAFMFAVAAGVAHLPPLP